MKVLLTMCFPVVGGILAMHLLQEVVHYLVAKWRRIEIGPPVPVPSLAFGMFGCITPIRSFPSSRAALLDFALSGPFATTIASIGCIIASLLLTVRASPASLANFPVLPAMIFKSSFLAGTLTSWIASKAMMLPLAQPIPVHPLFLVGYSGLMACGLNFLPIFRLDGGRACSAAVGPRQDDRRRQADDEGHGLWLTPPRPTARSRSRRRRPPRASGPAPPVKPATRVPAPA